MTATATTQTVRLIAARINTGDFVTITDDGGAILRVGLVEFARMENGRLAVEWADGTTSTIDPLRMVDVSWSL